MLRSLSFPPGLVTELHGTHVSSVALGKAHAVAVTNKGLVYTMGINNKGQCGRDFNTSTTHGKDTAAGTSSASCYVIALFYVYGGVRHYKDLQRTAHCVLLLKTRTLKQGNKVTLITRSWKQLECETFSLYLWNTDAGYEGNSY